MAEKRRIIGVALKTSLLFFILVMGSGCSEEQQFPGSSRVATTFQLKTSALDGPFTVQQAYLKLDRAAITGTLGRRNVPEASQAISPDQPPFRLAGADSAHITFTLASQRYDVMDLHLFLFTDPYDLVVTGKAPEDVPAPGDSDDGDIPGDGDSGDDNDGDSDNDADSDEESSAGGNGNDDDDSEDKDDGNNRGGGDDSNDEGDKQKDNDENKKNKKHKEGDKSKSDKDGKNDKDKNSDDKDTEDGKDDRRASSANTQTVDLDHFFQNAKPGIAIFGIWDHNGQKVNVVFAVTAPERLTVRAMQNNELHIALEKDASAVVSFDPQDWFQNVSANELQSATIQLYQGQPVLFIHKDFNSALFEKLFAGLSKSVSFDFDSLSAD